MNDDSRPNWPMGDELVAKYHLQEALKTCAAIRDENLRAEVDKMLCQAVLDIEHGQFWSER